VGSNPERILAAVDSVLRDGGKRGRVPDLWDGRAAERIVEVIADWLAARGGASRSAA
jgi:UDP-N-acetylglucosamine 2-epimerase (non-hydrolysing)